MISADESAHIRLVDDESLDSASEHNVEIERHKGRRLKPKLREAGTNTDEYYEPYAHRNLAGMHQEQRYYYDNGGKALFLIDIKIDMYLICIGFSSFRIQFSKAFESNKADA